MTSVLSPEARRRSDAPRRPTAPLPTVDTTPMPPAEALGPTVLLLLTTLGALVGYGRMFVGGSWAGPTLATVGAGYALGWLGRRLRVPTAIAIPLSLVVVALVGMAPLVSHGIAPTWSAVHDALVQAQQQAPHLNPPVPVLPGFRLLAAWGAGLVAVLADWAAFRLRTVAQAIAPPAALVITGGLLGPSSGRLLALMCFAVPALVFLAVQRNTVGRVGMAWAGVRPRSAVGWGPARLIGGAAILAGLISLPFLGPQDGHGVLGWRHGGGSSSGTRSVVSPIVDLQTRLVNEPDVDVMTVQSPIPSYWRLTSLDTFTGVQWQSTNSYYGTGRRLPGVAPAPPGTRQVTEQFHLQTLASIWLPAAFDPESVAGGGKVTWDPISGSLLTARTTANGLQYQVTSLQELATLDPHALQAAPPPDVRGPLAQDVALPPIDPAVRALAERITTGQRTEYGKALALQDYFHGPQFRYSLEPPEDGYGTDALTGFLFDTHTGYCQQFAGAYAVMARSIGLPTRLAVGFTTGTEVAPGSYQVKDANAHTWPEVYFPRYGWLPFEPTKGGFGVPGASGYTGNTTVSSPQASTPSTVTPSGTQPAPAPHTSPVVTPLPATPPPATSPLPGSGAARPSSSWPWWPIPAAIAAALAAGGVGVVVVRRRRQARRRLLDPSGQVLAAWGDAEALLAWSGVRRRPDETITELASRAAAALARTSWQLAGDPAPGQLPHLAAWASAADYGAGAVTTDQGAQARASCEALARFLKAASPWHRRVRWWADPRLIWPR